MAGYDRAQNGAVPDAGAGPTSWKAQVGEGAFSPDFHAASELIGRKWTGAIVRALFHGKSQFRDIADTIPGISDRLLSERLKELLGHGIVERRVDAPGYLLTEKGRDLRRILIEIAKWAHRWREGAGVDNGDDTDEGSVQPNVGAKELHSA